MNVKTALINFRATAVCVAISLLLPVVARAHCDNLDGPVVSAARKALETGNVKTALAWVQQKDETEVKKSFERTLAVRKLTPEAREFADMYFFETLVRIHRAGEGAPYTGLKPAGQDLGAAIPAADKALATGSIEPLTKLLTESVKDGLQRRFQQAIKAAKYAENDAEAGRRFVRAYVDFIHYAQHVYDSAGSGNGMHRPEVNSLGSHDHSR
jgi:hypothetical protein